MKKNWLSLLVVLLFAALAMACASAEVDEDLILGDGSDLEVQLEAADDALVLEDDLSMDDVALPITEENDGISLDLSPEGLEPATVPADNAVATNDGAEDFEIINGILVKYKGAGGDVVIPNSVTVIGESAFAGCSSLTGVSIPDSVTNIGVGAFEDCSSLTSVSIPDSVTSIGEDAFSWCSSLTSVSIPDSVTSIGDFAFYHCSSLTSVSIPGSVTSIGHFAFDSCSSLTSISIPDSVTSIGHSAFDSCSSLTSVSIPDSVTSIEPSAFGGCSSLTSISIPGSVTYIDACTFFGCTSLTSVSIPNSVTSIGGEAFFNCSSLTSVSIPNSVTSIEEDAFSWCSSLTSVSIPNSVKSIGDSAFYSCSSLTSVSIGKGLTYISNDMFSGCQLLESIVLPANISSIGSGAFKNCYSLLDVTLLNSTMDIDDESFFGCPTTMKFHTPCDSATTKWAKGKGYKVVKSDHTPVADPAVAPTCTETGLTEGSHCSVCGKVLVKQKKIPKLISLKKCKITGIKDAVYTGKAIKPAPVVKYNGVKLVKGTDYTVKYAANKAIGTATVTITGKGKYGESVRKIFKINPKAVALSTLTAGKQQLTVKWKKGTGITGYEVQYGLKKSFAGAKTVTIKKAATVKTVLKNLTTGKTYYVRIRAYKTVNGKKYFSAWSKAKSAKVK
ncbi:MAG: fibronectin type III domain-containing protein [Clostridia bacterium]|nr:fibronectin type III domain-containing protein [Clostridia bacterium]